MVDDLWKQKNAAVLKEYGDPTAVNYTYGSYFYDNYVGPYYYVQEQQRLRNIVRGRMGESITKSRSGEYLSRTGGLDLARSMVVSKPKVTLQFTIVQHLQGQNGNPPQRTTHSERPESSRPHSLHASIISLSGGCLTRSRSVQHSHAVLSRQEGIYHREHDERRNEGEDWIRSSEQKVSRGYKGQKRNNQQTHSCFEDIAY